MFSKQNKRKNKWEVLEAISLEFTGKIKGTAYVGRKILVPLHQRACSFSKANGKKQIFQMGVRLGNGEGKCSENTRVTRHTPLPPPGGREVLQGKEKKTIDLNELRPETEDKRESNAVTYGDHISGQIFSNH